MREEKIMFNNREFDNCIQEADNSSLRDGAANRILQLLEKQRYSNEVNNSKRWIWELCQNAKDACNSTKKVKINIKLCLEQKKLYFEHNGRPFSMSNIVSLINQSSSKDRSDCTEKQSGKFGTGFITTHLLSEIVNISGILKNDNEYYKFNIPLDRSGKEKAEIKVAMEEATNKLKECSHINHSDFEEDEYNTVFQYDLDDDGIKVAKDGLESLKTSAPFVLAMIPEISEINIVNTDEKFCNKSMNRDSNTIITEIEFKRNGIDETRYVLEMRDDNVSIFIAFEKDGGNTSVIKFEKNQPKLICDFPLIGTEDFPFPVIISSPDFNPTEPRDGVFLVCKNMSNIDNIVGVNRDIISRACTLYGNLLKYISGKRWGGIYNVTKISSYHNKGWYDKDFIDDTVEECKKVIERTPIVCTEVGTMNALKNNEGESQIYIVSDEHIKVREQLWDLLSFLPDRISRKDDLHEWYGSLWPNYSRFKFVHLLDWISGFENIDTLINILKGYRYIDWLNKFYAIIDENESFQKYIVDKELKILLNQNGEFCNAEELYFDIGIDTGYNELLMDLHENEDKEHFKRKLVCSDINRRKWMKCKEADDDFVLSYIESYLQKAKSEDKEKVYTKIVFLYKKSYKKFTEQKKICSYVSYILDLDVKMKEVKIVSEDLLSKAMKALVKVVAEEISECGTVDGLADCLNISKEEAKKYIVEFIEFVVSQNWKDLIEREKYPILPNQNGKFVIENMVFIDNEIDEVLKDIVCIAGDDIRERLLEKDIYLKLPKERDMTDNDIVSTITKFVQDNRNTKDTKYREAFNRLLVWINDSSNKAKEILPFIYENKHYLYDDEDIVNNIKQSEKLTDLMSTYNISSINELEGILKEIPIKIENDTSIERASEKKIITNDVLIQYGISSEEKLNEIIACDSKFAQEFFKGHKDDVLSYKYANKIIERSHKNIIEYLNKQEEYEISFDDKISNTIFLAKKNGEEIYVLARPSDGGEIRIYYEGEKDILDFTKEWEIWVEDGLSKPQKITFGKIIKLTGLNRIPLKEVF